MKTKTNIKLPKLNQENVKKGGAVLIAAGTILKAGVDLLKLCSKNQGK